MFVTGVIIVVVIRSCTLAIFENTAEKIIGEQVNKVSGAIICQMWESLDPNGSGTYDAEVAEEYLEIVQQYNYDFERANRALIQMTIKTLKTEYKKMPSFLIKKGRDSYGNDKHGIQVALEQELIEHYQSLETMEVIKKIEYLATLFYFFVVIGMVISCASFKNDKLFFIILVVVGAMSAGLLIESQGRYKYSVEPIWCVLVANAICILNNKVKKVYISWKVSDE